MARMFGWLPAINVKDSVTKRKFDKLSRLP